jgi:hypothetical protein
MSAVISLLLVYQVLSIARWHWQEKRCVWRVERVTCTRLKLVVSMTRIDFNVHQPHSTRHRWQDLINHQPPQEAQGESRVLIEFAVSEQSGE